MASRLAQLTPTRELLLNLTLRDLRGRYRKSILGWTWSFVTPLSTIGIYIVVFGYFLKVQVPPGEPSGFHNFPLFMTCGFVSWNFFTNTVNGSMSSLLGNANLIQRVYLPRQILVFASVGSALITALIEVLALVIVMLAVGNFVLPWIPLLLVVLVLQLMFVSGIALILSPLNVYFRDLEYITTIGLNLLFYAAPIVYSITSVPMTAHGIPVRLIYGLNPTTQFVNCFRYLLYDLRVPPLHDLLYLVAVSLLTLGAGILVFRRLEPRLAEEV